MVPHDARHGMEIDDDDDDFYTTAELDNAFSFHRRRHSKSEETLSESLHDDDSGGKPHLMPDMQDYHHAVNVGDDLEIKPEIDTGDVSDACFSFKKLWKYAGPGLLMSIAYLDPGNLESDLQSGAIAGYRLLWLLFWAHVIGLIFQLLSARLGTITGRHLAQLIRESYSKPMTITLWTFAQVAIIGADIMEIVGTAVALHILLNLPLWAGVLLTSLDTFTFMMIQRYGMRKLEAFFMVLVLVMTVCFWVEMFVSKPDAGQILRGILIPIVPRNTAIQAVGMLGAIVMPHNMFLHSALVKSRDLGANPTVRKLKEANYYFGIESALALFLSFLVNLAIVVVFAEVFYDPTSAGEKNIPGLADADVVLSRTLGSAAKYLWAAGLLAAGQSSTMTGTLAGQYVTEGFFGNIFKKEWHRVAATRSISLIPSVCVAIFAVDHFDTMGELLNVLQSVCLPTVLIPILKLSISPAVVPKEFRLSTVKQIVCWLLTAVVVSLDVFLFVSHATTTHSFILILLFGTMYLVFLIWLIWLPLDYKAPSQQQDVDDWVPEAMQGDDAGRDSISTEIYPLLRAAE
ncbi:natural resistance-associated macrophage protein-domain-containing protein [Radiomyces spectabilis]|uniref:natural resistance-associated macrophage protein-domain-containing protein n=1 Tax=Radiomyces spectabilis TaxID=64574 RepID=UPI0022207DA2|nr:natural resistance-associated macrophage protein-domain-containing protein [Radiomyces spectabilis]KAI8381421.1 natural resistance-associated macrophage protein-domain-containing protein [Radiomyces spectabilis]